MRHGCAYGGGLGYRFLPPFPIMFSAIATLLLFAHPAAAASDGICILYSNDDTRSFYFSGVTPAGALHPQLLNLPSWDALLLGLDSGEDEDTMYVVPQGVGSSPNMTIATIKTLPAGTANVSYATLGEVPGFEGIAPYTYMPMMHLDAARGQMIATLVGLNNPPPTTKSLRDPGDLFLVIADVSAQRGARPRGASCAPAHARTPYPTPSPCPPFGFNRFSPPMARYRVYGWTSRSRTRGGGWPQSRACPRSTESAFGSTPLRATRPLGRRCTASPSMAARPR